MGKTLVDSILELKQKCRIEEEIGSKYSLTPREISCILALGRDETLSSADLSARLSLSPSRGSRVIGSLYRKGYLQLQPDEGDKRCLQISFNQPGRKCLKDIEKEKVSCENRLIGLLDKNRAAEISRHLEKLVSVL